MAEMAAPTPPPAIRRLVKPVAVVAVLLFVAVQALMPSSGGSRPSGPASTDELDAWFDRQMADAAIPGAAMVVVRDGQVVDVHSYGAADDSGSRTHTSATIPICCARQ